MKKLKRVKGRVFKFFCMIVFLFTMVFFCFSVWDVSNEILVNEMQRQCSLIINDSVNEAFKGIDGELFEIKELNSVNIMSINAYDVNTIRAKISNIIYDRFDNHEYHTLKIHLGTVMCPYIFAGKGPYIEVSIVPVSEVMVNLESVNETHGINQVVNNLYVDVEIDVKAAGRINLSQTKIETRIVAVQTLISGGVPETYVNVDKGASKVGK